MLKDAPLPVIHNDKHEKAMKFTCEQVARTEVKFNSVRLTGTPAAKEAARVIKQNVFDMTKHEATAAVLVHADDENAFVEIKDGKAGNKQEVYVVVFNFHDLAMFTRDGEVFTPVALCIEGDVIMSPYYEQAEYVARPTNEEIKELLESIDLEALCKHLLEDEFIPVEIRANIWYTCLSKSYKAEVVQGEENEDLTAKWEALPVQQKRLLFTTYTTY